MKISGHKTREIFDRYNMGNSDDLSQIAKRNRRILRDGCKSGYDRT